MAYSQSDSSEMSNPNKYLGVQMPKFYMIKYNDVYSVIAMQMDKYYLFNMHDGNHKIWRSVLITDVEQAIESIDIPMIESIKKIIQSATSGAVRLLIVCASIFHAVPSNLNTLLDKLSSKPMNNISYFTNIFTPLHLTELKQVNSINILPWKLIYINNLLQSRSIVSNLDDWYVVLSPQKYIFDDQYSIDRGIRLIQLHKAINQLTYDDKMISDHIHELSQALNQSITQTNFNLPDICLCFQYLTEQTLDMNTVIQEGILLITKLARVGIINNSSDISNIAKYDNGIAFKSYEHAILAHTHGIHFDFKQVESTINTVYKKNQTITNDPIVAFNCYVMYDIIRLILSVHKDMQITQKSKQILVDANSIMKQIYDTHPTFDYKKSLSAAAEWLYDKHYSNRDTNNFYIARKTYDLVKYQYLNDYLSQYDLS